MYFKKSPENQREASFCNVTPQYTNHLKIEPVTSSVTGVTYMFKKTTEVAVSHSLEKKMNNIVKYSDHIISIEISVI